MIHLSGRVYFLLLLFGCIFASVLWVCVNQFIRTGSDSRSLPVCLVSCLGLWLRPGLNVCHRLLLATGLWLYPGHYACTRLCFFVACIFLLYFCLYTAKKSTLQSDVKTLTREGEKVSRCRCSFTCSDWKHLTGCKTSTSGRAALKTHWSFSLSLSSWLSGISLRAGQRLACCFVFVCNV